MHIETATVENGRRFPGVYVAARFVFVTGQEAIDLAAELGVEPYVRGLRLSARPFAQIRRDVARGRTPLASVVLPVAFRLTDDPR